MIFKKSTNIAGFFLLLTVFLSCQTSAQKVLEYTQFKNPEPVTIRGFDDHAMEPFVSRDGEYLFFNNSNAPGVNTEIHYATRIDDLTYQYKGILKGASSDKLDGVPTMDEEGNFYFVSVRNYFNDFQTIYGGKFSGGDLTNVGIVYGISKKKLGHLNFDLEVSADGNTIYFVDGIFSGKPFPDKADIAIAVKREGKFKRLSGSEEILDKINTKRLEYAPAISEDELEIFFTRHMSKQKLGIFRAVRKEKDLPFGKPRWVSAIKGHIEAPTLSPDERSLYYHKKENGKFVIYRVTR
ncbi:MAG: hypothetical protein HKN25_03860 [Pyrinomonadaceae bacterium]|nr:hypothetical protein [Pyrinomonadaceae bacterium]